jgi:hypothetical protein
MQKLPGSMILAGLVIGFVGCAQQPQYPAPPPEIVFVPDYLYFGDSVVFEEYGSPSPGCVPAVFSVDSAAGANPVVLTVDGRAAARLNAGTTVTAYLVPGIHRFTLQRNASAPAANHVMLINSNVAVYASSSNRFQVEAGMLDGGSRALAFRRLPIRHPIGNSQRPAAVMPAPPLIGGGLGLHR